VGADRHVRQRPVEHRELAIDLRLYLGQVIVHLGRDVGALEQVALIRVPVFLIEMHDLARTNVERVRGHDVPLYRRVGDVLVLLRGR
jgi:hypothetical protein